MLHDSSSQCRSALGCDVVAPSPLSSCDLLQIHRQCPLSQSSWVDFRRVSTVVRVWQFDNASYNFSRAMGKVEIVIEHEKRSPISLRAGHQRNDSIHRNRLLLIFVSLD